MVHCSFPSLKPKKKKKKKNSVWLPFFTHKSQEASQTSSPLPFFVCWGKKVSGLPERDMPHREMWGCTGTLCIQNNFIQVYIILFFLYFPLFFFFPFPHEWESITFTSSCSAVLFTLRSRVKQTTGWYILYPVLLGKVLWNKNEHTEDMLST